MILLADSEGPDETAHMRSLIWAFAVRLCLKTYIRMAWLICEPQREKKKKKKKKITYLRLCAPSEDSNNPAFAQSDLNIRCVHFGYRRMQSAFIRTTKTDQTARMRRLICESSFGAHARMFSSYDIYLPGICFPLTINLVRHVSVELY